MTILQYQLLTCLGHAGMKVAVPPSIKNKRGHKSAKQWISSPASDSQVEAMQPLRSKRARRLAVDSESEPESDTSKHSVESNASASEMEPAESIAKTLFGEVPTVADSDRQKRPHERQLAAEAQSSSKTPPPPIWGSQYRPSNARGKKLAAEIPMWDPIMTSSSFELHVPATQTNKSHRSKSTVLEDELEDDHSLKSELYSADESPSQAELPSIQSKEVSLQVDPTASLVYTKTGSVRLTGQNTKLHNVMQHGILEVKAYIAFEHRYPEIAARNVYAQEILLKAARYHNTVPIEKRMQIDDGYVSALTNLIDACASLFRSEIKDVASKNVLGYFRLSGAASDTILDRLLANHSYIFPQTFDGLPSPNRQKPYQTQPVFLVLYEVFFKQLRSVGAQFGQRFLNIAKNKSGRPQIPIPMMAMVCTAIRAILLAKKNRSSDDFKFTGNQFFDIYTHHVSLLERIQTTAPVKFHKMMADIYEEVNRFRHSITGVYDQDDQSLSFLDLEGMKDE
ncbi:uncharacterized protein EDB91DRAFT_1274893 [Suillus paluster]|uniref:uncharacterized protein n=1 Tax=Suillus paluster TaxID=48578 RepID=UPI001B875FD1|nr:uncharacterized protein EDB91DRAFT_1274893 [Suillus paluster]KAG1721768.1 hypothetical protein EDB91DRAFT_1274893 [Suillus paluster]